jgi:ribosome-associated translation inhibitor RaiA
MKKPQSPQAKKFKSKWFRVATEGASTDGRHIQRDWIEQMANTYDPQTYGARIWLEHIRGIYPDSDFRAYGDVLALEAREVEEGKLALFAQISPTPELIEINKKRQKIYTSIEVAPKFAETGKAYLTGLAVTDSPASLGTQMLEFARQKPEASPFSARKTSQDCLFSEALEATLEFSEDEEPSGIADRVKEMLARFSRASRAQADENLDDLYEAIEALTEHVGQLDEQLRKFKNTASATPVADVDVSKEIETLAKEFREFRQRLEKTPDDQPKRPLSSGGTGAILTDI